MVHRRDIHRLWTESDRFARGVFIEHGTQGGMAIRRLPVPLDIVLPGLRHGAFEAELVSLQAWWSAGA